MLLGAPDPPQAELGDDGPTTSDSPATDGPPRAQGSTVLPTMPDPTGSAPARDQPIVPRRIDDPDRDLAELITAGALTAALEGLMARHGDAVYRYCRELLRDGTLADDVHQLVFIHAHRDMARFAARSTLRTWLFAIARNRVLDAMKARRRKQARLEDDDTAEVADPSSPPWELLDEARLAQLAKACVARLAEPLRTAVMLRYQQGFTFEEMAEICREKAGTLQARVTRALQALRTCIEARTRPR